MLGICPKCGEDTRGDQCDACGAGLEPENLLELACAICGKPVNFKNSKHLYISITKMEQQLKKLVDEHPEWRKNAITFTNKYIGEGLRDRALTRDLEWGIPVPKDGYENKTIYIWAENVLGYLSASKVAADKRKDNFEELWGEKSKHYYVHGKDNIPFHTIILPALLIGNDAKWHLPDSIRYYFLANGPEKKDADFSWREYVHSHNGELLGAYGNFINRSLTFISKYWNGIVPNGSEDVKINEKIEELYVTTGKLIEKGAFKEAINELFDFIRAANKFFDTEQPWITRETDEKVCKWLNINNKWERKAVSAGYQLPEIEILFQRLDKKVIEEESEKLKAIL